MTTWHPQRGLKVFEPDYKPEPRRVHDAVLNPLPDGTPVRATIGETVVVGYTIWQKSLEANAYLTIVYDGSKRRGHRDYLSIDLDAGWSIEVTGDPIPVHA